MNDETHGTNPPDDEWSAADDDASGAGRPGGNRDWLSQLQAMIDNAATTAAPVLREVAAKAAELAAVAGEKAGPIAHKAAEVTAQAGTKVAERGREVAAELRRDAERESAESAGAADASSASPPPSPIETLEPGAGTGASSAGTDASAGTPPVSDSADTLGE